MCAWSQWTGKNFFSAKPTTSCSQDVDLSDFVLFLKIKSELRTQWKIHKNTVLKVAQCFEWDNETKDFHCLLYTDHTSTLKPLTGLWPTWPAQQSNNHWHQKEKVQEQLVEHSKEPKASNLPWSKTWWSISGADRSKPDYQKPHLSTHRNERICCQHLTARQHSLWPVSAGSVKKWKSAI